MTACFGGTTKRGMKVSWPEKFQRLGPRDGAHASRPSKIMKLNHAVLLPAHLSEVRSRSKQSLERCQCGLQMNRPMPSKHFRATSKQDELPACWHTSTPPFQHQEPRIRFSMNIYPDPESIDYREMRCASTMPLSYHLVGMGPYRNADKLNLPIDHITAQPARPSVQSTNPLNCHAPQ
jgi:hypothetical protein